MANYTSDDELMQAASQGEETAFVQLQTRHWTWMYRLLLALVQDVQQAEDLAQEAFYQVYRHRHDYIARGQFVAWLKRIAVNLAKNYLRKQRRALQRWPLDMQALGEATSHLDPQSVFFSHLLRQEIRTALRTLNAEQQQVLLLYYFSGLSVQTIAERLQCPVGTVKSRLFYGRRQLRQALLALWDTN